MLLASTPGRPSKYLKAPPGFDRLFVLFKFEDGDRGADSSDADLYQLVLPATALDLPSKEFLAADGRFYTGDLFEKANEEEYISRGRADDWIKDITTKK